jgi:mediator of RNA polymerase II transcription subunit 5
VGTPSILRALWRVSSFRTLAGDHNGNEDDAHKDTEAICGGKQPRSNRWASSYSTEETLFYRLAKHISSGTVPHDIKETVGLVLACIQWMNLIVSIPHSTTAMLLPTQAHEIAAQNMALGTMVVAVVENAKVQRALSKGTISKTTRKELEKVLGTFIATLVQNSPQSAARLEMFRTETLVALLPEEKEKEPESRKDGVEKEMDDILEGGLGLSPGLEMMVVEDLPSMNSRAGLYVFLNSLVSRCGL